MQAAHEEALAALRGELQELTTAADGARDAAAAKDAEAREAEGRAAELEAELEETKAALGERAQGTKTAPQNLSFLPFAVPLAVPFPYSTLH